MKLDFVVVYLTKFFVLRKLKNTSAMRVIFFLKIFKIESKFRKRKKKIEKIFFVSQINAYGNVAINCLCSEESICFQQSIGPQTFLRFCTLLRETF